MTKWAVIENIGFLAICVAGLWLTNFHTFMCVVTGVVLLFGMNGPERRGE